MLISGTWSRLANSGVPGLLRPRRDIAVAAKHAPDIDVVVVLDVEQQVRESSQRPGSEARQVQLMGVALTSKTS